MMSTTEMWSAEVYDENPVHTRLKVYNYGGLAGTLCVNTSDAPELVARLTTHMRSENVKLRSENRHLCGQRDAAVAIAIRTQQERYALHDALEAAPMPWKEWRAMTEEAMESLGGAWGPADFPESREKEYDRWHDCQRQAALGLWEK